MPRPRNADPAGGTDCLTLLGDIERRWQDALSHVHAQDPLRAVGEVEQAGEILAHLGRLDQVAELLDPATLEEFTARMQRLGRLHHELTAQARSAQSEVGRALHSAKNGRCALTAYGKQAPHSHRCDEVV